MDSRKRTKNIAFARQVAMYITRQLIGLSLPQVGNEFGGRDHTTVLHAEKKVIEEMKKHTSLKIKINNIIKEIEN